MIKWISEISINLEMIPCNDRVPFQNMLYILNQWLWHSAGSLPWYVEYMNLRPRGRSQSDHTSMTPSDLHVGGGLCPPFPYLWFLWVWKSSSRRRNASSRTLSYKLQLLSGHTGLFVTKDQQVRKADRDNWPWLDSAALTSWTGKEYI